MRAAGFGSKRSSAVTIAHNVTSSDPVPPRWLAPHVAGKSTHCNRRSPGIWQAPCESIAGQLHTQRWVKMFLWVDMSVFGQHERGQQAPLYSGIPWHLAHYGAAVATTHIHILQLWMAANQLSRQRARQSAVFQAPAAAEGC